MGQPIWFQLLWFQFNLMHLKMRSGWPYLEAFFLQTGLMFLMISKWTPVVYYNGVGLHYIILCIRDRYVERYSDIYSYYFIHQLYDIQTYSILGWFTKNKCSLAKPVTFFRKDINKKQNSQNLFSATFNHFDFQLFLYTLK